MNIINEQSRFKERPFWEQEAVRYLQRGISGFNKSIILKEWGKCAELWKSYVEPCKGMVLDLGAGNGEFWNLTGKRDGLVLLDIALNYNKVTAGTRISGDAGNPPFKSASSHALVAIGLSEYIPDLHQTLTTWRSLVKDDGKLLITWSPGSLLNWIRRFRGREFLMRGNDEMFDYIKNAGWNPILSSRRSACCHSMVVAEAR